MKNKKAFTLLEVITVIGFLSIFFLSFIPLMIKMKALGNAHLLFLDRIAGMNAFSQKIREEIRMSSEIVVQENFQGFLLKMPQKDSHSICCISYTLSDKDPSSLYRSVFINDKCSEFTKVSGDIKRWETKPRGKEGIHIEVVLLSHRKKMPERKYTILEFKRSS